MVKEKKREFRGEKRRRCKTEREKSEWGASETIQTQSAQTDLWATKDFKAAQFLAVERIWPGLIKEKHFDFTWQEKPSPSPAFQKGEVHEACPITKSMWPEMERKERERAGQRYRAGEGQRKGH